MADIWLDYSGARPSPHDMKKNGVKGVVRYLSEPVPATSWKRITASEKNAILNAGLDLILNWEWYEGRMLEGYNAGLHDGKAAMAQAKELGYPKGASIYFSHDTSANNDSAVLNYMRGVRDAMGGYYAPDIYSGIHVVDMVMKAGLAKYGWQTVAWSNGNVGSAHLYQNGKQWYSRGADENVVLHATHGSWLNHAAAPAPHPSPTPAPTPSSNPVPSNSGHYTVKSGDNLTVIAQRHHTTVKELVRLNPSLAKRPDVIKVGQVLTVPGAKHATPSAPKVKQYRVVSGDNLAKIAKRFGTSVSQVQQWNASKIKNPNLIQVGWVLRVG